MFVSRRLCVVALAALVSVGAACTPPKAPSGPTRPQSEWAGPEAQLLDDGIDVGALPLGDTPPGRDEASEELIPRRMDVSDAVVLAKVIAVSTEPIGANKKRYRLELATVETLSGTAPDHAIVLTVEPSAPAFGTVRALEARLIGRKLVMFFRQYAAEDGGDPITHFHLSAPTKPVLEAVSLQSTKKELH